MKENYGFSKAKKGKYFSQEAEFSFPEYLDPGVDEYRYPKTMKKTNSLLIRYWFKLEDHLGVGVTAYSLDDALSLLSRANFVFHLSETNVIENVDLSQLDQNHVLPNIGAPNVRGIWYPNLNL